MNQPEKSGALQDTASNQGLYVFSVCAFFCISLGLNNGFILGGLTAFDPGFLKTLDISVAQLKLRDSITLGIVGVFALLTGALVDRLGALRVLMVGHGLFAAAFLLLSRAQSIEAIYVAQALLGLCQLCAGYLVCVIAISRYLPFGKGLAIGLMLASTSLANAFLPQLNTWLINTFGPQTALMVIAGSALPLILGAWLVRLAGPRGGAAEAAGGEAEGGPSLKDALKRLDFWMITLIAAISFFSFLGIVTNLAIYVSGPDINAPERIAQVFTVIFIVSLLAQSSAGWLADRLPVGPLHIAGLATMTAGAWGLSTLSDANQLGLWLGVAGLGWGFNYVFIQIAVPSRFQGKSLGKIFGAIVLAEALAGAAGPWLFGRIFDQTDSYTSAYLLSAALLAAATVAALILYRPKPSLAAAAH